MNTKPFTKVQLRKIKESWDALEGRGIYRRATKAEPTVEQLKEIQESYSGNVFREIMRPGTELALLKNYSSKLVSLGLSEEYSGVQFRQFENDEWTEANFKNPPSRQPKTTNALVTWAEKVAATAISNSQNYVPTSNPEKLKLFNDVVYEFVTEQTLLNLRSAKIANSRGVPLTQICRYVKKAFMEAIEREDVNFFARVGDVLRKRQLEPNYWEQESSGYDELDLFLCVHWVKEFDGIKPLYNLSIKELSKSCHEKLPGIRTLDAIEKRRQRLGLLRLKKIASRSI